MFIHNLLDKNFIFMVAVVSFLVLGINAPAKYNSSILVPRVTPEPLCDNYAEIENFAKPIPIVWTAKMDGCLVSCEGASFTRVPEDKEHPRFSGYYPGGLEAGLMKNNSVLKIYGDLVGIDADHPYTVFDNKCVPVVNINKVEILK